MHGGMGDSRQEGGGGKTETETQVRMDFDSLGRLGLGLGYHHQGTRLGDLGSVGWALLELGDQNIQTPPFPVVDSLVLSIANRYARYRQLMAIPVQ